MTPAGPLRSESAIMMIRNTSDSEKTCVIPGQTKGARNPSANEIGGRSAPAARHAAVQVPSLNASAAFGEIGSSARGIVTYQLRFRRPSARGGALPPVAAGAVTMGETLMEPFPFRA